MNRVKPKMIYKLGDREKTFSLVKSGHLDCLMPTNWNDAPRVYFFLSVESLRKWL